MHSLLCRGVATRQRASPKEVARLTDSDERTPASKLSRLLEGARERASEREERAAGQARRDAEPIMARSSEGRVEQRRERDDDGDEERPQRPGAPVRERAHRGTIRPCVPIESQSK